MRLLDLFSGIGGFSLGLERAGFQTVAFCEIEPFCQAVLKKHWPDIPIYEDIRTLTAERLAEDGIGTIDVIAGGFPCQDISSAGNRAGIEGEQSGLWSEFARLICDLRPRYVIVENVADLLARGFGDVLGDLASSGYDAEWDCIPAATVGSPQLRDRLFIIAYPNESRRGRLEEFHILPKAWKQTPRRRDAYGLDLAESGPWSRLPDVLSVDYGVPGVVDRIGATGNSVLPQIPEIIGKAIMEYESHRKTVRGGV